MVVGLANVGIERVLLHQSLEIGIGRRAAGRRRFGAAVDALGRFLAGAVDESRRDAERKPHHLALEVGAEQVLRHDDILGEVAAHHQQIGASPHHFVDLRAERVLLVIEDHSRDLDALRLDRLADRLEGQFGERRLRHHAVEVLRPHAERDPAELLSLQHGMRLRAHEIALVRQQREQIRRRDRQHHHLVVPAQRQHGGADGGRPHAHDRLHLVDVDELARGADAGLGIGLIVLGEVLELAAEKAARRVDLIDHRLMRQPAVGTERRARTGKRHQAGDPDRPGLSEARRRQHEWCCDGGRSGQQCAAARDQSACVRHDNPFVASASRAMIAAISPQGMRGARRHPRPRRAPHPRARCGRPPADRRGPQSQVRRARSARP